MWGAGGGRFGAPAAAAASSTAADAQQLQQLAQRVAELDRDKAGMAAQVGFAAVVC